MNNLQNLSKPQLIALVKKTENSRKRGWAKYFQVQRESLEGFKEIIQEFEYFSEPVPDYFEKTFRELVDKYKHLKFRQVPSNVLHHKLAPIFRVLPPVIFTK